MIIEGSETRRKFLDSVISQMNSNYLQLLIQHQKLITQRNALLKSFVTNNYFDRDTLEIYNDQIELVAQPIYETRRDFLHEFIPIFNQYHKLITGNRDEVNLVYESQLEHASMRELFDQNIQRDRALQYTSVGIHKDDLVFLLKESPIKKFGSQGQQKSFLIALKLAQFEFLKKQHHIAPILLFDDIFDKLDELRVRQILELVNLDTFGQMFITDTHLDRTEALLNSINKDFKIFTVE